jgi:putative ABC transport system ATP-binding protein
MIRIENLHVTYNRGTTLEKKVLHGLDLTIDQGEFLTVIGGNGAGKSTLLSVLTGDVLPTKGKLFFDGEEVTKYSTLKRAHLVARVFQDPLKGTCGELTVEENLALAYRRGQGRSLSFALNKNLREKLRTELKRLHLGVEKRLKDPISSLSGGQRQAISLIMAVLAPSKILLLDEHTAALDPRTAAFIINLTKEIVGRNHLTTVMVTHSMSQALEVGTRTIMLADGVVVYDVAGEKRSKLTAHDLLSEFEIRVLRQEN